MFINLHFSFLFVYTAGLPEIAMLLEDSYRKQRLSLGAISYFGRGRLAGEEPHGQVQSTLHQAQRQRQVDNRHRPQAALQRKNLKHVSYELIHYILV